MAGVQKIIQSMAANHVHAKNAAIIKAVRTVISKTNPNIVVNQTRRNIWEIVTSGKHIKQMKAVKKKKIKKEIFHEMNKFIRDLIMTAIFLYAWCLIWEGLEILIYGHTENRIVDTIMTLILIPILYMAVSKW